MSADDDGLEHSPTMRSLLRERPHYRRLVLGNTISQLGDWLSYVAVSLLTVSSGEGGVALALVFLAHSLPSALTAPWAGRLADRYDRRSILIGTYASAALVTALMCWAAAEGQIFALQALLFVRAGLSTFGNTARQAATPSVVERRELYLANALVSLIWSTLFTLGVALGGVLTSLLGPTTAIAIDALTFVASILAVWGLPSLMPAQAPAQAPAQEPAQTPAQEPSQEISAKMGLWGAWRVARRDPQLAAALLAKSPAAAINGAGWVALTLMATKSFGDSDGLTLGLFHAARGLGTGLGPFALKRVWPTSANQPTLLGLASIIGLISTPLLPSHLALPAALLCLMGWGMGLGHNYVRSSATIQLHAPSSALGRLTAFDMSCFTFTQSATALFTGYLIDVGWGWRAGVYATAGVTLITLIRLSQLERAPRRHL